MAYKRFHDAEKSVEERFWNRVNKTSGCWEWCGTIRPDGYGILQKASKVNSFYRAHRLSWALHNGDLPDNLHVCHKCDNPRCVNPDHLFLGTDADNQKDKWQKGRGSPPPIMCGSANPYAKLTEKDVKKMRELRKKGWLNREIAELFPDIHPGTVKNITGGRAWKHVN